MVLAPLIPNIQLYFLIFSRVFALFQVAPVVASSGVPSSGRAGLAFFTAFVLFPMVETLGYVIPQEGLLYGGLVLLEALTGLLIGLFLQIVFVIFQMAGQMFAIQMGFGASSTFDPLSQVEIPLVGQLFNLLALLTFLVSGSLQKLFYIGLYGSFQSLKGGQLLVNPEYLSNSLIAIFAQFFEQSLLLAFPMVGTLMMVSITMGLLGKAAPQMNLMMVGFPIQIAVGFLVIFLSAPFLISKMIIVIENGFYYLEEMFRLYKEIP